MGKAISDEELQLKKRARRRLVGAIALVLLIVVFLPMILDSEPRPLNQDIAITIPPIPKADSTGPAPTTDQGIAATPPVSTKPHVAGLPEGRSVPPEAATATDPKVELPKSDSPQGDVRPAKPAQKHEAKPGAAGQVGVDDGFVVQLGAFSNAANARTLQKKLQDNKFKAYTETIKSTAGDRTRVRVGPYRTREEAEKARERLKSMKLIIGDAAVVRRD